MPKIKTKLNIAVDMTFCSVHKIQLLFTVLTKYSLLFTVFTKYSLLYTDRDILFETILARLWGR